MADRENAPTDRVRADHRTALDRLGSEKALLALTEARLETPVVLETTGAVLATARATVADWAGDAEGDVAAALSTAAAELADATDRVADSLGADLGADADFLSLAADTDAERAGAGLVGVGLVLDRLLLQGVSFFVNEADETRADLFRDLRGTADRLLELAADLEVGEEGVAAAGAVVEAAYDEYVARLDAMGFDPKPIC